MKNFFCVTSKFFDDGTVSAKIMVQRFIAKPSNTQEQRKGVHIYHDWYGTMPEAREQVERCNKYSEGRTANV